MITCDVVYVLKNLGGTLTTGNFVSTDRIRSYGFRFRKAYKNERHKEDGKTASPELIKQMIHRYSIKCVDAWLKPALNLKLN